ncbi:hypothetical protein, partial [Streptomyces griseoluteus]|uniref:hypothetical protein n=1 Tax=Streptomyces griseoluteus TaxID=29306 RepID=UPI0033206F08
MTTVRGTRVAVTWTPARFRVDAGAFQVLPRLDVVSFGESSVVDEAGGDGCEREEVLGFPFVA